jgi:hypothetical protein
MFTEYVGYMDGFFLSGTEGVFFFSGCAFAGDFFFCPFLSADLIFLGAGTPAGSPLSSSRAWRLRGMRSLRESSVVSICANMSYGGLFLETVYMFFFCLWYYTV